jgi:competence protein ComK
LKRLNQKKVEEYEINSCTMFLQPVDYGSKVYTQVFEVEDEFLSPFKPLDIVKKSCDYFGCDYESRKRGTRQLIGYSRKVPIAIEPTNHIFFFPTTSPSRPECIWISHDHVEKYRSVAPKQTLITFQNKQSHLFPVSSSTIECQMLRASLLRTKLLQRIEQNERKLSYFMNKPMHMKASEDSNGYGRRFFLKERK